MRNLTGNIGTYSYTHIYKHTHVHMHIYIYNALCMRTCGGIRSLLLSLFTQSKYSAALDAPSALYIYVYIYVYMYVIHASTHSDDMNQGHV
jgi:hypothetical protein